MGSSLSHQEELFLRRQWADLLEDAMAADTEAATDSAAALQSRESANPSSTSAPTAKKSKKKDSEFRLSFQEWQAFLSVLEQKDASAGPSDIVARLAATQLHAPVVALTVHLCMWFRGAIPTAVLSERVNVLLTLVDAVQKNHASGKPEAAAVETTKGEEEGEEGSNNPETEESESVPVSRRARLARFVQKKVVERTRRHATPSPAPGANSGDDALMLDAFADMLCLVEQLLSQDITAAHCADRSRSINANPPSALKEAKNVFELYDHKISNADTLRQRPVMAVVMVLVLAVYATKVPSQPQLATRSVAHLEALECMLLGSTPSGGKATKVNEAASLMLLWPILGELEVALVHRQHEADVLQCLSADGDALLQSLSQMRDHRESMRDALAPTATASERWNAGASQYIGQRHIWTQLRTHFLSAGVFEADKPTVLVFFGPSGYGKSELAKRVASVLHDCPMSELESSGKMVYIHMPSFCTKDSIYSLVDPPAAHVGSGILLSALQKHPDAVVVLDEFEKSTAESINNLWLSAFQKNGVLRSLKEASRSVSTVRTTFILTCNIAAESIAAREDLYLTSSPADQEKIRALFVTQCKDVCRQSMGDPFVNRVDYFFPFLPYTRAERRQFVLLLLERLLSSQASKNRQLCVTPVFVEAMVDTLHTFHAATLEEAVRSQVMRMVEAGWTSAVLTVERRVGRSAVVLLPAQAEQRGTVALTSGADEGSVQGAASRCEEAWGTLPGGEQALEKWRAAFAPAKPDDAEEKAKAETEPTGSPPPAPSSALQPSDDVVMAAPPTSHVVDAPAAAAGSPSLEKEYEYEYTVDKVKITELEKELEKTRDLVKQRDLEIVTLKERIFMLQKVLAVVVLALMSCLGVLALVIGVKLTLLFALTMVCAVVFVLGVPLAVLLEAVQALFRVLGPIKGGVLVLLIALWMARASKSLMTCA